MTVDLTVMGLQTVTSPNPLPKPENRRVPRTTSSCLSVDGASEGNLFQCLAIHSKKLLILTEFPLFQFVPPSPLISRLSYPSSLCLPSCHPHILTVGFPQPLFCPQLVFLYFDDWTMWLTADVFLQHSLHHLKNKAAKIKSMKLLTKWAINTLGNHEV